MRSFIGFTKSSTQNTSDVVLTNIKKLKQNKNTIKRNIKTT